MNFLARYWPYIAVAIALAALWGLHLYDNGRYAGLQTDYANYRTQVADANEKAQRAAREALEAQIADRTRIDKHNAEVLADYEKSTAAIAADRDHARDLVRRLLASRPGGNAAPGGQLSQADHKPGTPEAGTTGSDERLGELLIATAAECRGNAAQLNALVDEVKAQL